MRAARALTAALAVVVCAWFVLSIRQATSTSQATSIISGTGSLDPPTVRHVRALLSTAGTLNPDLTVDVLRAQLDADLGEKASAKRILLSVVHREPMNIVGWYTLGAVAGDQPTVALAIVHIARLERNPR